jgi:hypothetical protein
VAAEEFDQRSSRLRQFERWPPGSCNLDELGIDTPVVLYTFGFDYQRGFLHRAFAVTEAPDEAVHYVIDLMERARLS